MVIDKKILVLKIKLFKMTFKSKIYHLTSNKEKAKQIHKKKLGRCICFVKKVNFVSFGRVYLFIL